MAKIINFWVFNISFLQKGDSLGLVFCTLWSVFFCDFFDVRLFDKTYCKFFLNFYISVLCSFFFNDNNSLLLSVIIIIKLLGNVGILTRSSDLLTCIDVHFQSV